MKGTVDGRRFGCLVKRKQNEGEWDISVKFSRERSEMGGSDGKGTNQESDPRGKKTRRVELVGSRSSSVGGSGSRTTQKGRGDAS